MAISYNWLFQWDYTFYKWGDLLVLITGITRAITAVKRHNSPHPSIKEPKCLVTAAHHACGPGLTKEP